MAHIVRHSFKTSRISEDDSIRQLHSISISNTWDKVTLSKEADQFTLEDANAFIPWLAERFRKIDMLWQKYATRQKRIADFQIIGGNAPNAPTKGTTTEELTRQIEEGVDAILDEGIIVRDME